jgi:hypothetical protein
MPRSGIVEGRMEMKTPPGTSHGGQQVSRDMLERLLDPETMTSLSVLKDPPRSDPHDWTLILVPSHHVASINGANVQNRRTDELGVSHRDPKIRFLWPDILRQMWHHVLTIPPRLVIETREFGYARANHDVAEFIHTLRAAHEPLTRRAGYSAQWVQL